MSIPWDDVDVVSKRSIDVSVMPEPETDLYDVKRLAQYLGVKPNSIRSLRNRGQLPEPTASDINGGAVWHKDVVTAFFSGEVKIIHFNFKARQQVEGLPPVIDLFSGCGGMSLGFEQAGFKILHAYDNWKCAVETYEANFSHAASILDLSDLEAVFSELKKFESEGLFPAIIGGPPCQDFSSAGRRVEGARADLTEKFADIVTRFNPPFFVMENVARAQHAAALQRAVSTMREGGYAVEMVVLDASLCGVPQRRKRLITVGSKNETQVKRIVELLQERKATQPMTMRDWFGDRLGVDTYYRHPRSYARRAIFSIDEPSPTIRGVNRPIPVGYPGHSGDAGPVEKSRPLTTVERAEVQTFPTSYLFKGSKTDTEQMIGNAVPVNLATYVGVAVADSILDF